MKNQYFGDIYDYIKYGLLRRLSLYGNISMSVCWMLTENDDRKDGHRVNYLREPEVWRGFDPPVFDCLRTAVLDRKERNVGTVEKSGLLPNTSFYSSWLTDGSDARQRYFDQFLEFARGKDLIFFDPDNGLEVKSVKYGRKGASRYLFLREISRSFSAGHSLLVYQHFPPKPRDPLTKELARKLVQETGSELVYVFRTTRVAFLLVPQNNQLSHFSQVAPGVVAKWDGLVDAWRYVTKNDNPTAGHLRTVIV